MLTRRLASFVWVVALLTACSSGADSAEEVDADSFMPDLISAMKAQKSVSITMEVTGPDGFTADGDMVFGEDGDADIDLRGDAAGEKFVIRGVDGRTFVAYDSLTAGKFYEVDTVAGTDAEKGFAGVATQIDPSASFAPFAEAVDKVTKVEGPETVAGVQAQRYRVVVDPDRITGLPELDALPDSQVPDTFEYDFWVDDEGLLRRAEFELGGFGMKGDYLDYGEVDRIEVPTGDDVTTDNPFAGLPAA